MPWTNGAQGSSSVEESFLAIESSRRKTRLGSNRLAVAEAHKQPPAERNTPVADNSMPAPSPTMADTNHDPNAYDPSPPLPALL